MSEAERDRLRERVAAGAATGDEHDQLADALARTIRDDEGLTKSAIDDVIDELGRLVELGSDRRRCTDALAGALLDAQIRAFERRDPCDAWRRLDQLRAQVVRDRTPDLLHDRLAAALLNAYRGAPLLADEPMRLAALEELQTRAQHRASGGAYRVVLSELLADAVGVACRRSDRSGAELRSRELERLVERNGGRASARELARALRELSSARLRTPTEALAQVEALVDQHRPSVGDPLVQRLAEIVVLAHAEALRGGDDAQARALLDRLHELVAAQPDAGLRRQLGEALHDRVSLGSTDRDGALAELCELGDQHGDVELLGRVMRALVHRHAIAGDQADWIRAEQLLVDARARFDRAGGPPELVEMYAQMLVNAHVDASRRDDDVQQPVGLLDELRELAQTHPQGSVQLQLATALFNAHVEAGRQGSIADAERLLAELDRLVRDRSQLVPLELRRRLVMALVNHHGDALERDEIEEAAELLDRLRTAIPADADDHMRVQLAMALGNALGQTEGSDTDERACLVSELRVLAAREDASEALQTLMLDALSERFAPLQ